jgi:hypothetical protein
MKLLKTIRADPSDTFVFEVAAEPGEWAVSGAFMFARLDPAALTGKARAAFRAGFLGISSFGWSTLVQVVAATDAEHTAAVETLAAQLVAHCGAPDIATARRAAAEEIAFAASLCAQPRGTLAAVSRRAEDGNVREVFRTLAPRLAAPGIQPFAFLDAVDDDPTEQIDLKDFVTGERR